jgi:RNA polymerase sigma-70 factor (ECF subfamily)
MTSSPSSNHDADDSQDESGNWESLRERLEQGDSLAQTEVFELYSIELVRLAEKNIHPVLNRRFDGDDIVQSVFRTFFRRQQEGKFSIEKSEELWRLLVTITVCKTRSLARKHTAKRRDVHSEQQIDDQAHPVPDKRASDQDLFALCEEIDLVLKGLPKKAPEILAGRLEGKTKSEIAKDLNLSRQTIHRILNLVEERLKQRFDYVLPQKDA